MSWTIKVTVGDDSEWIEIIDNNELETVASTFTSWEAPEDNSVRRLGLPQMFKAVIERLDGSAVEVKYVEDWEDD